MRASITVPPRFLQVSIYFPGKSSRTDSARLSYAFLVVDSAWSPAGRLRSGATSCLVAAITLFFFLLLSRASVLPRRMSV